MLHLKFYWFQLSSYNTVSQLLNGKTVIADMIHAMKFCKNYTLRMERSALILFRSVFS